MRVDLAPASLARRSTSAAKSRPALSLSGQRITSLPSSGEKSNLWATRSDSMPAPPIVQVAAKPMLVSASAHFSPSAHITVSASKMFGMLYRGLGSGRPMRPFINWRNCFLTSPSSLSSTYLRTVTSTTPSASVYVYSSSYGVSKL